MFLYIFKGLHTGSESFQPFFFCFFVYSKFPDIFFILLKVWFVKFVSVFYRVDEWKWRQYNENWLAVM